MTGRMEVVGRVSGRRRWSDAEKLEILAEAFRPGVRVCDVIAHREVSSSLIYTWRKHLREGKLAGAGAMPSLPVFADPQIYIADVIARVAGDWPASRWEELMPWNWSPEPARLAA